ncbi:MAG: hypothetical protein Q8T08_14525 [Ignavibacteria bacterium]|jgi:hypothetical protein|nr:hypothetical protein [Ignavibacteria bacterium]
MKKQFLYLLIFLFMTVSINSFAQGKQDFTLVNNTGVVIHNVYITAHNADDWGDDILGKDVFNDGEETDIQFDKVEDVCKWDLRISDEEGNAIEWENIDLCKWAVVTLHWDGKKATATFE